MWGGARTFSFLNIAFVLLSGGCGGGGGDGGGVRPPPPTPDFTIAISTPSVTIAQGATSSPVSVSVTPLNGFSGNVSVTLSGIPSGITTNPSSPFTIASSQSASVILGAASDASIGQFSVSAQAASGTLSHSVALALTVQQAVVTNLPHSTYVRTESVASLDLPVSEPHRRHLVYDSAGHRFFVANQAMNRVDVLATSSNSLLASIDAPAATSVDLSSDGSTLWVATALEQILAVDTQTLQVKQRFPITGLTPIPGVVFNRPLEVEATPGSKLFVRLHQPAVAQSLLALWDPSSNSFTDLTSSAPAIFQKGLGVMARSGDSRYLFAAANDATGESVLFDAFGNVVAGPQVLGSGTIAFAALNFDGSRVAALLASGATQQLLLFDARLNLLSSYSTINATSALFSRDGQTLYLAEVLANSRVISALSAANLQKIGMVPDLAVAGIPTTLEDLDSTQTLCGLSNRGVNFLDVSQFVALISPAPTFANAPVAQPAEAANTGGSLVTLAGANFSGNATVRFGSQNTVAASGLTASQLQVTAPSSAASGPVNLIAYFSNNWLALAPSSFSFGPTIAKILPNAAAKAGGDTVQLYGYGFGADPAKITVTIGGQAATVVKVDALPAFASSLLLNPSYPFSLERVTITTPPGLPGKLDITLASPSGSTTLPKAFQFLYSSQTFSHPGLYKFVLYDPSRHQVFLSATDHIDVFDTAAQVFRNPIQPPPNGPPPNAALRGLALTPDHSQLVVADFGAQSVYLINPDGAANNGARVSVGGVAGYLNSGPARIAATSAQTVFVGLSGEGNSSSGCNGCLGQINLMASPPTFQPAPQPEVTSITGAPLLQSDSAGDSVYLAYRTSTGGPVAAWSAASPNVFQISSANDTSSDLTVSSDGTLFALHSNNATEIRGSDLTLLATPTSAEFEAISQRAAVPGVALHPSGALVYEPFLTGPAPAAPPATGIRGGIDIRDAHNGKLLLRLYLPEPFAMLSSDIDGLHASFLTTDEFGQRLFAITTSGLTVIQLASVPLGIGSLSPSAAPLAGGTSVTIRGSGFQSTTRATLGGKQVTVTFKDMNTLTLSIPPLTSGAQKLVLTNSDGESTALDAALSVQ